MYLTKFRLGDALFENFKKLCRLVYDLENLKISVELKNHTELRET